MDDLMRFTAIAFTMLLFSISSLAYGESLTIKDGSKVIHLQVGLKKISYQDENFKKIIHRKKCNQFIFDSFRKQINNQSKKLIKVKGQVKIKEPLQVILGEEEKLALRHSKSGRFFSRIPSKIKNIWLTSKRVCKK